MYKEVFRLAALLACIALATSRLGLIGHELVGHGGVALACGATIVDVQLFWFAGGWLRYELAEPASLLPGALGSMTGGPTLASALAISMGGIAVELVVGLALSNLVRPTTLGRRLVRGIGLALVVHATWYLATGAFHGFGDGLLLYRMLGVWRVPFAIAAGLATCAAAFLGARCVLGVLVATLPGSPKARLLGVLVAAGLAGGLHVALAASELAIRRDTTYASTMQHERDRVIARQMERWQREHSSSSEDDQRAERNRLERAHRTFPFVWLLAAATAAALLAGSLRAPSYPDERISNRLVGVAAAVAGVAISAVIAIDAIL